MDHLRSPEVDRWRLAPGESFLLIERCVARPALHLFPLIEI
jgi:hypothetical protein